LPDGIFFKPKIPIWVNFGGSFNNGSFVAIRSIFPPFGIFCGHLEYFPRFGKLHKEKSGNPDLYKKKSCKPVIVRQDLLELGRRVRVPARGNDAVTSGDQFTDQAEADATAAPRHQVNAPGHLPA
jgi:hypothetical protein